VERSVDTPIRSIAIVAAPDAVDAVLRVEPGETGTELLIVTTAAAGPAGRRGRWELRPVLDSDPCGAWSNAVPATAGADLVVFVDGVHPEPGWLAALVATFLDDPHLGAAQPVVLDHDGAALHHVGALVASDASVTAYGRGEVWIDAPPYRSRRHADALAPSCLAIRGSSLRLLAADDLDVGDPVLRGAAVAFAIRRLGARTLVEPAARVRLTPPAVDVAPPASGLPLVAELVDHAALVELRVRWARELALQASPTVDPDELHHRAHAPQGGFGPGETLTHDWIGSRALAAHAKTVWMIDPAVCTWDRDTGHLRAYRIIEELRGQGHQVVYWADNGWLRREYEPALSRLGVMSFGADQVEQSVHPDPDGYLATFMPPISRLALRHAPDLIWLAFHYLLPRYGCELRAWAPQAALVLDTVDVHHVREAREAEVLGDDRLRRRARSTRHWELASCPEADAVVCVSDDDAAVLRAEHPDLDVHIVSVVNDLQDPGPGFDDRRGCFFVASFVPTPNGDAVRWYRDEIQPRLDALCDGVGVERIPLTVAGNDPMGVAAAVAGPGIDVVGRVPDVLPYLHAARVSIAPLRWGAGVKGKVSEALAAGLPVVGTTVAFEGLQVVDGEHGLVADDADAFATAILRLHEDRETWERIRAVAPPHVDGLVGRGRLRRSLAPILELGRPTRTRTMPVCDGVGVAGRVSVVIHSEDGEDELRVCLSSLDAANVGDLEVVVVDDAQDPALDPRELPSWVRVLRLPTRAGYRVAVEHGLALTTGELVLAMGAELLLGPGWAPALRSTLADPGVGAVGFRSNHGRGAQRSQLAPYSSDREMTHRIEGAAGRDELHEVASLHPSGVGVRRRDLVALAGTPDADASQLWTGTIRAHGARLVVHPDVAVHHQHPGARRLDAPRSVIPVRPVAPPADGIGVVVVARSGSEDLAELATSLDGLASAVAVVPIGEAAGARGLARRLGWTVVEPLGTVHDTLERAIASIGTVWALVVADDELVVVPDAAALRALATVPGLDGTSAFTVLVDAEPDVSAWGALARRHHETRIVHVPSVVAHGWVAARAHARPSGALRVIRQGLHDVAISGGIRRRAVRTASATLADAFDAFGLAQALEAAAFPGAALDIALEVLAVLPDDPSAVPVASEVRALALRSAAEVDSEARDALLGAGDGHSDGDAATLLGRVGAACDRGDLERARELVTELQAIPRHEDADPTTTSIASERWLARIELAEGGDAAWRRLVALGERWGALAGHWDDLVAARPPHVRCERLVRLAREQTQLPLLLESVAALDPAHAPDFVLAACGGMQPSDQHRLVAVQVLGVAPDGAGLSGLGAGDVVAAAVDALRRRRERRLLRRSRFDRDLTVVLVAEHGVDRCLAWLEALEEAGHNDRYQLVVVDNGSRDGTWDLLGCLEGDVDAVRLPAGAHTGHALLESTSLVRGRTSLLCTTADLMTAAVLDEAVRAVEAGGCPTPTWLHGAVLADSASVHEMALIDPTAPSLRRAVPLGSVRRAVAHMELLEASS
jgi:O-antigen biosynthesis protein